jgi:hypothetical protein
MTLPISPILSVAFTIRTHFQRRDLLDLNIGVDLGQEPLKPAARNPFPSRQNVYEHLEISVEELVPLRVPSAPRLGRRVDQLLDQERWASPPVSRDEVPPDLHRVGRALLVRAVADEEAPRRRGELAPPLDLKANAAAVGSAPRPP